MSVPAPHFLLFSEASRQAQRQGKRVQPHWRFVLEAVDGSTKLEAADEEPEVRGDRLDLLAVVRGLEALDQPSRVTLLTPSQYVCRGLRFGLEEWRETDWQWERFGQMMPVKNRDLWKRVDRALQFHDVEVRNWRFDEPEGAADSPQPQSEESFSDDSGAMRKALSKGLKRLSRSARRWGSGLARRLHERVSTGSTSAIT